jgi:cobalt-zinc-cadmium efflux system outer membrane protein
LKRLATSLLLVALVSGCAHVERRQPAATPTTPEPSSTPVGWQPTRIRTASATGLPSTDIAAAEPKPGSPTTLEAFEELALASNPTLAEFRARIESAEGRRVQVGLSPNPVIGLSFQEMGNDGSAGQYGAFLSQPIITANKLDLNRNEAGWGVTRAERELASQRLRVLTDVRRTFHLARVAQERVAVAKELHAIASQAVLKARELVKNQEPRTVLTQAEIELEVTTLKLENTRIQHMARWRGLVTVVGQPGLPLQDVAGSLSAESPDLVWNQALETILRDSPELSAAVAEVERTRAALLRANAGATPNWNIQAGAFYDDASQDTFATFQLSMPIPVHNRNQGGIAQAQADTIAARQVVERIELHLQQRLAVVFQKYEQGRQQAARYRGVILEKAKQNLDLNRQSYESGESSYLAVLTAQRSYSETRLAWLDALEQLWTATVEIQGLLLSGSLE